MTGAGEGRPRNLVLVGFMGTGKTSVGREVACILGLRFIDTDALIESSTGMPVSEIFARRGEAEFRDLEARAVAEAAAGQGAVITTGGGALERAENIERLRAGGYIVNLMAGPAEIYGRLSRTGFGSRPLLAGADPLERITALLAAREAGYARAHARVDTTGKDVGEVAAEVARLARAALALDQDGREIWVGLGDRSYPIVVGADILASLGARLRALLPGTGERRPALVVTHPDIAGLYLDPVAKGLAVAGFEVHVAEVPAGEPSKSLEQAGRLYDRCLEARLDRHSPVIALGGGVIGDLAGFVAATYLRGIPFAQVPTTLLAQVDSSVGGKVGINHPQAKNMIGAFHQPRLVIADVATLRTLPAREYASGLAEAVKHGVIADAEYFGFLETCRAAILRREDGALGRVVSGSCRIKAAVVEQDEREARKRMILNFGHTVGHAIESVSGYGRYLHGEAVAIGMVAAGRLALALGRGQGGPAPGWAEEAQARLERLLAGLALPVRIPGLPVQELIAAISYDKKVYGSRINWVIPSGIGRVEINDDVPLATVLDTLLSLGAAGDGERSG